MRNFLIKFYNYFCTGKCALSIQNIKTTDLMRQSYMRKQTLRELKIIFKIYFNLRTLKISLPHFELNSIHAIRFY